MKILIILIGSILSSTPVSAAAKMVCQAKDLHTGIIYFGEGDRYPKIARQLALNECRKVSDACELVQCGWI